MIDIVSKKTRSRMMSSIKSKDTKPEMIVRRFLHRQGFRYRLHVKKLPGSPDIVLPKYRTVIFVHGCFWHQHEGCSYATMPSSNREFWLDKFSQNQLRDSRNLDDLHKLGWKTIVVWECGLRTRKKNVLHDLIKIISQLPLQHMEIS